jgi:patatin-like phospholipase/acyl hydrolase
LSNTLDSYFEDVKIDKALTELIIPATCESDLTQSYIFNRRESIFDSSKNFTFKDVLLATTAAPTYFPSHVINGVSYVDGGVALNNPTMKAYSMAIGEGIPIEKIHVISMGTGNYIPDPLNVNRYHGLLFWAKNFPNVAMSPQEGNIDADTMAILRGKYERWQVWLDDPIGLDDCTQVDNLIEIGNQFIEELYADDENKMNKLLEFLEMDKYSTDN